MRVEEDAAEQKMPPADRTNSGRGRARDEKVSMTIEPLSSLILPGSLGIQRDHIVPEKVRPPQFDEQYDFHTLFYDAFFVPKDLTIRLVCPRLLNLEAIVKEATFTSNGEKLEPRLRRRNWRNDEISLTCSRVPTRLRIRFRSMDREIPLGTQDRESFRGLRCAVLKSRNNDLAWITDWAKYHVMVHGLEGLLFFDNGSDQYTVEDVNRAFLGVDGLQTVRVLSAPFPFGPTADGRDIHKAKFLQGGLMETARVRYLQTAAAVLLVDIDELVSPVPKSNIFALAEQSALGCVSMPGRWQYPGSTPMAPARHVDHVYVSPTDAPCRTKYCIVPQGRLGDFYWDTHGLGCGRSPRLRICRDLLRKALKRILTTNRVEFWHCRKITTHRKCARDNPPLDQLRLDFESKNLARSGFQGDPSEPTSLRRATVPHSTLRHELHFGKK
jgi:hypothetical protein